MIRYEVTLHNKKTHTVEAAAKPRTDNGFLKLGSHWFALNQVISVTDLGEVEPAQPETLQALAEERKINAELRKDITGRAEDVARLRALLHAKETGAEEAAMQQTIAQQSRRINELVVENDNLRFALGGRA